MSIASSDFGRLYRDHLAANRNPKPAGTWDAHAADMSRRFRERRAESANENAQPRTVGRQ